MFKETIHDVFGEEKGTEFFQSLLPWFERFDQSTVATLHSASRGETARGSGKEVIGHHTHMERVARTGISPRLGISRVGREDGFGIEPLAGASFKPEVSSTAVRAADMYYQRRREESRT